MIAKAKLPSLPGLMGIRILMHAIFNTVRVLRVLLMGEILIVVGVIASVGRTMCQVLASLPKNPPLQNAKAYSASTISTIVIMVVYVPNPEYSFLLYSAPVAKLGTT
jgi:hypothetical protein